MIIMIIILSIVTGSAVGVHLYTQNRSDEAQAARMSAYYKERDAAYRKEIAATKKIQPWYSYHAVAHALGGVDEREYMNSIDGFYANYDKGYRLFEMDLLMSIDNVLVGRHKWGKNLSDPMAKDGEPASYSEFKRSKLYGKYTPTSLKDMMSIMDKYKDFYIITDTKDEDAADVTATFENMVQIAKDLGHEDYLDRLVIQVYSEEMYATVKKVYPFKHFIYTTYKQSDDAFFKTLEFCVRNKIEGLTCRQDDVNDYRMARLRKYGIYSYTHSVNDTYLVGQYMKLGVYGIYSDFLSADEINYRWFKEYTNDTTTDILKDLFPPYKNM